MCFGTASILLFSSFLAELEEPILVYATTNHKGTSITVRNGSTTVGSITRPLGAPVTYDPVKREILWIDHVACVENQPELRTCLRPYFSIHRQGLYDETADATTPLVPSASYSNGDETVLCKLFLPIDPRVLREPFTN